MSELRTRVAPPSLLQASPRKVSDLEDEIDQHNEEIKRVLAVFREALLAFGQAWMQEFAKTVAVAQDEHTVKLGRKGIRALKEGIRDAAKALLKPIEKEFPDGIAEEFKDASSGQVKTLVSRRFDQGIRKILTKLMPTLEAHGFQRDDQWITEKQRGRRRDFELTPDLREQLYKIAGAIVDIKVLESKITFYKRQRGKDIASELWDSV